MNVIGKRSSNFYQKKKPNFCATICMLHLKQFTHFLSLFQKKKLGESKSPEKQQHPFVPFHPSYQRGQQTLEIGVSLSLSSYIRNPSSLHLQEEERERERERKKISFPTPRQKKEATVASSITTRVSPPSSLFLFHTQPATVVSQNGSSVGIYHTLHARLVPNLWVPSTKFLSRSSVGSLLSVRCWLGTSLHTWRGGSKPTPFSNIRPPPSPPPPSCCPDPSSFLLLLPLVLKADAGRLVPEGVAEKEGERREEEESHR